MEQRTIGKFLSALRKANGYTQQQVAEFLCVSNKTISKWECDDGYPEITVLPAIAELYGVTVDEILNGERMENATAETVTRKAGERTKMIIETAKLQFKNYIAIALPLGISAILLSFLTLNDTQLSWIGRFFALILIIASVIISVIARNNYKSSLNSVYVDKESLKKSQSQIRVLFIIELLFVLVTFTINFLNIFVW